MGLIKKNLVIQKYPSIVNVFSSIKNLNYIGINLMCFGRLHMSKINLDVW